MYKVENLGYKGFRLVVKRSRIRLRLPREPVPPDALSSFLPGGFPRRPFSLIRKVKVLAANAAAREMDCGIQAVSLPRRTRKIPLARMIKSLNMGKYREMAKNQNTIEKRRREMEKKRKAEEKRERRRKKKELLDEQALSDTPAAADV